MRNVIILCQGRQQRIKSINYPKQFIKIDDEPIIQHTINKTRFFSTKITNITIVANRKEPWVDFCRRNNINLYSPETPGSCIVSGMFNTIPIWGVDVTTILLGDVIYTYNTLMKIMVTEGPLVFFGSKNISTYGGEIFALNLDFNNQESLSSTIRNTNCIHTGDIYQPGHMRNLLWPYLKEENINDSNYYSVVTDGTTDIDTDADIARLKIRSIK